jgi:HSP20 family molecular chaperone IbpA
MACAPILIVLEILVCADEGGLTPAVDVLRDGETLLLWAEVPEVKPEDVMIEVEDDVLPVSGRHEEGSGGEG